MAPDRQVAAQNKRNRLPFKPPRRQSSTAEEGPSSVAPKTTKKSKSASRKSTTAPTSAGRRKPATMSTKRKAQSPPESEGDDSSENGSAAAGSGSSDESSNREERLPSQEPDYILAEIVTNQKSRDIESGEPAIPPKLLTKLLHHHFQNSKTKIAKDANEVVAKYIDIFVREALARAAYERAEGGGAKSAIDGFLEVEDLEKLAPQMILDF